MSYEEFVELYNDRNISTDDIKKVIGRKNYIRYREKALKDNDIKQRPSNLRFGRQLDCYKYYHYDKSRGAYRVHKVKNGKYISYGFFNTEEEAKQRVEFCKKHNWNEEEIRKYDDVG